MRASGNHGRLPMWGRLPLAALAVAVVLAAPGVASAATPDIYWTNGNRIGAANLDGSGANQSFITGLGTLAGVTVDSSHVYWTNFSGPNVGRADRDGSNVNTSLVSGAGAQGVVVDSNNVFWGDRNPSGGQSSTIGRADLDGSNANHSFITGGGVPVPGGISPQYIYWVNKAFNTIGRANIDGSGVTQNFVSLSRPVGGVAVDGGHIYWTDPYDGKIGRANIDGSGVNYNFITGLGAPQRVAVGGSYIYWTDPSVNWIGRAKLDGSDFKPSFIPGASGPVDVAVDVPPDFIAPSVTIASPTDGATYAQNQVVNADYSCSDESGGSGLESCNGPVPDGSPIDTSTAGSHSFTVTATDLAGNTTVKTVNYTVLDVTAPTITINTPQDGATYAQAQVVNADYSCTDNQGGSGIRSCDGTVPDGQPIDTSTLGPHSFTVIATDNSGNTTSKTVTYTVTDQTPPTVTISAPRDGATYAQRQTVRARYSCADSGGSGVRSCRGSQGGHGVADGGRIDTHTNGRHSFTATATDNAGNTTTKIVHYTVVDRTRPKVTITIPRRGATYHEGQDVRARYSCTDSGGSGVRSCRASQEGHPVAKDGPIDTRRPGRHSFTVTAIDKAGNRTTKTVRYTVTGSPGGGGGDMSIDQGNVQSTSGSHEQRTTVR